MLASAVSPEERNAGVAVPDVPAMLVTPWSSHVSVPVPSATDPPASSKVGSVSPEVPALPEDAPLYTQTSVPGPSGVFPEPDQLGSELPDVPALSSESA